MSEEKKHIIYTAADIKRYITGEMQPAEMHAMEMAALDDPLLAEAMEGYELMEQKDWSKELAALKQQFNKNENSEAIVIPINKTTSFKSWKTAAAIVVLGVTATTAYIFTSTKKTEAVQEIAKVDGTVAADSSAVFKTDSVNTFANTKPADSNQQLIAKFDKPASKDFSITPVQSNGTLSSTVVQPAADSIAYYNNTTANDYAVNEKRADDVAIAKKGNKAMAAPESAAGNSNVASNEKDFDKYAEVKQEKEKAGNAFEYKAQNNFYGYVLTPDNKPISYAHIDMLQNNKPVYTDANGRFTFKSADTAVKITVSSVGYTPQMFTLQTSALQNKIILQPQYITTESVITTAATRSKARKITQPVIDISALDAEPTGGWVEYNNYISNNLQLPETVKQNNIHGEVEISVKLKENGDISKVKVAKPLCPECDAEAVRLVKEGPKWDTKGNKKAKVKVKF